jgi:RluA family pseudouridine synthase
MKERPQIIFEDESIIVVNKPAFWLSIPDRHDYKAPNLVRWLKLKFDQIYPVHRLDRETTGIICFAKYKDVHAELSILFQDRKVEKDYLALVSGVLPQPNGTINVPLAKKANQNLVVVSTKGKPALTHYQVITQFDRCALLKVTPITGRTHQIRVHLKALGYPLMVDKTYGKTESFYLSEIKPRYRNRENEKPLLSRTPLHASRLHLPVNNKEKNYSWDLSLPKDMKAVLYQVSKLEKKRM